MAIPERIGEWGLMEYKSAKVSGNDTDRERSCANTNKRGSKRSVGHCARIEAADVASPLFCMEK